MGRKVTLYIGGQRADMDDRSPILFNYAREELDNPTVVRNSYTHQLTLPGTAANAAIFGHFSRLDRAVSEQPGQTTGVAFNALKRAPFALYGERGEVLARGYAKLDAIQRRGEQAVSYSVTLYGGLGSLFYDLSYDAQGEARTLADLIYDDGNGGDLEPENTTMAVTAATVAALWGNGGAVPAWADVLTFAPCYNGIPEGDFDANKALVSAQTYNFPDSVTEGGTTYKPYGGAGGVMVATFQNKHSEWEMRDFRAWQQRPAVRVKAVLEALADPRNSGEWSLVLSGPWFSASNAWWEDLWMTLPLLTLQEGQDWATLTLADALRGGCSPAAFLTGYAKTFGLVFDVDESAKTVTLMERDDYYAGQPTHELTFRLDRSAVDIVPVNASAKWYELGADAEGAFCKDYADTWGRRYGSQRIDTGWAFDSAVRQLLPDSYPFRAAADVLETSALFRLDAVYSGGYKDWMPVVDAETVKYKLYATQGDLSSASIDAEARVTGITQKFTTYYNSLYNGHDAFPKVQLHEEGGKATAGSGVLLLRVGSETLPTAPNSVDGHWHVTNDTAVMATINGGRSCWIAYAANNADVKPVSTLPSFRRMGGALTCDFGAPREVAVAGETAAEAATIYWNRWRAYLADRLDWDTKVMTAKVDLRGWKPGTALMRRFFWYENALWALNRIRDYAPALDGPTTCEFVQVRDKAAYESGQEIPAGGSYYLSVSPLSIPFDPAGQAVVVTVTSNVAWTLTVPAWLTASALSGSGNGSVTLTAGENSTGSTRSGAVAFSGAHSTSASVAVSQSASAVPSLSLYPQLMYKNGNAGTATISVTCNGAWSASSDQSWAVITGGSSGSGNGTVTVALADNGGAQRDAVITVTSGALTETATIRQLQKADTKTYALDLGAGSHAFSAAGGTYTLAVQGVTYTNGVETSRVNLSAADLTIGRSGSAAISRSGLTFSAADLGTTWTAEASATFQLEWTANGAAASFGATQEQNRRTAVGDPSYSYTCTVPDPLIWAVSGTAVASKAGDHVTVVPSITTVTTQDYVWTSGATSTDTSTSYLGRGTVTAHGGGLSAVGSPQSSYEVTWAANPSDSQRWGSVAIEYNGYTWNRGVFQQAGDAPSPTPSAITIRYDDAQGNPRTATSSGRSLYSTYAAWRFPASSGLTGWYYTILTPQAGDTVYSDTALTQVFGDITAVTQ